ncbi:Oidioi.mRNA.OKI2018_I69.chr1.g1420.t1.cds [Oikopleura dioica]|uniref:Oidioi.mRNA.OKI2018_I69.chr1.g1420.t1.cds n=1 Tax=Oikopleura dioica TaxID=34765 RepID=A0ABN7SMV3_OIKDI|nr:Oidioi.mRNA.OKI2018_I69.chr1.g1420.t1.cds [Oikopleura dioica]
MKKKIVIFHAGPAGLAAAQSIIEKDLASELIIIDPNDGTLPSKIADLKASSDVLGRFIDIRGSIEFAQIDDADFFLLTCPFGEAPSSDEALAEVLPFLRQMATEIGFRAGQSTIVVACEPADLITFALAKLTKASIKVVGTGTVIESAHFLRLLKGVDTTLQEAMVIGNKHSSIIPLWTSLKPIPVIEHTKSDAHKRQKFKELLKTGYSPARVPAPALGVAGAEIIHALCSEFPKRMTLSIMCNGQFDICEQEVVMGLPVSVSIAGTVIDETVVIGDLEKQKLLELATESQGIQRRLKLREGLTGYLEVDRSEYVGNPPHSPKLHRKILAYEPEEE